MAKKIVSDLELKDKTVLVRADFNVPLKDGEITNDNRIVQALPTIKYIIEQGGKVVLFSHLGKVKEESDKESLTLKPVADDLSKKLDKDVVFVPETRGEKLESAIKDLKAGDIVREEDLHLLSPGDGFKWSSREEIVGKTLLTDIAANEIIYPNVIKNDWFN